jgi:hypothetical protein
VAVTLSPNNQLTGFFRPVRGARRGTFLDALFALMGTPNEDLGSLGTWQ